jgi:hypothetical protein
MVGDPPGEADDDEDVVRPEDLDFTRDERVATMEDGRYVVSTGEGGPPDPADLAAEASEGGGAGERTPGDILRELSDELDAVDQPHGFAVAARFDGDVSRHAVLSDDLAAMFEELLTWTASRIDDDTPPEEILGILLLASGRSVRFPLRTFDAVVSEHGLSYDDSIADLARSLADDGFRVPPGDADDAE